MEIAEFLLARIAEDAGAARRVPPFSHRDVVTALPFGPTRVHIGIHDPARVLAECDAKRQLVSLHSGERTGQPCTTMRLLALPYADHAHYRSEWKP